MADTPPAPPTPVPETAVPVLHPYVRLQEDKVRGGWVLQAPERVLLLDESARVIVGAIDGDRPVAAIIDGFVADYDAPRAEIGADVIAVMRLLLDRDFLRLRDPETADG